MSARVAEQKQLQLLRNISQQLEKIALELQRYRRPGQEAQHALNENMRDIDAITDVSILETRLLERLAFFEEQFLPQEPSILPGQLSLLKRALVTLQSMQTAL